MFENSIEAKFDLALERSVELIETIKIQSTPFEHYRPSTLARQLYPCFLSYAHGRTQTAFYHLKNENLADAAISTRTILDASARAWACCFNLAGYLPDSDKEFEKFFIFEIRRNRHKLSARTGKTLDTRIKTLLRTFSKFDENFVEPLSAKDQSAASKFFEFQNVVRTLSGADHAIGTSLPKEDLILCYNFLSSFTHAGGMGIMALEKASHPNGKFEGKIEISNLSGVLGIIISSWYQTALISNLCLFDDRADNTFIWDMVKEIRDLIQPISEEFHSGLYSQLS